MSASDLTVSSASEPSMEKEDEVWQRIQQLMSQGVSGIRIRQKLESLNAMARHVAAAETPPPACIYEQLLQFYKQLVEQIPSRNRVLLKPPLETLLFALQDKCPPAWFQTQLQELIAQISAGTGEGDLAVATTALPPSSMPTILAPPPAPFHGQRGHFPQQPPFGLQEENLDMDFNETFPTGSSTTLNRPINGPVILPVPEKVSDLDPPTKMRRTEVSSPRKRGLDNERTRSGRVRRHSGVAGTMWDSPSFRKMVRLEDVQLVYQLRDRLVEDGYQVLDDVPMAQDDENAPLPVLEGRPETTGRLSMSVWSGNQAVLDENACSMCGLTFTTTAAKRTHIKLHFVRAASVLHQLLTTGKADPPVTASPMRPLIDFTLNGANGGTVVATLNHLLKKIFPDAPPSMTTLVKKDVVTAANRLPTETVVCCSALSDCTQRLTCCVCDARLQPTLEEAEWIIRDVVVGQLQGSTLLLMSSSSVAKSAQPNDIDTMVGGLTRSAFRSSVGAAYNAARAQKRECPFPEELLALLSRLAKAVDRDRSVLLVLADYFEKTAGLENSEAARLFGFYLRRLAEGRPEQLTDEKNVAAAAGEGRLNVLMSVPLSQRDAEAVYSKFREDQFLCHVSCAATEIVAHFSAAP